MVHVVIQIFNNAQKNMDISVYLRVVCSWVLEQTAMKMCVVSLMKLESVVLMQMLVIVVVVFLVVHVHVLLVAVFKQNTTVVLIRTIAYIWEMILYVLEMLMVHVVLKRVDGSATTGRLRNVQTIVEHYFLILVTI
jgi:hypothetical protein